MIDQQSIVRSCSSEYSNRYCGHWSLWRLRDRVRPLKDQLSLCTIESQHSASLLGARRFTYGTVPIAWVEVA